MITPVMITHSSTNAHSILKARSHPNPLDSPGAGASIGRERLPLTRHPGS